MYSESKLPIYQAVILAGGSGTRLRPLTDLRPKPMVEFSGRPFLHYIIEDLRDQGVAKILLLLGYLSESITDYFKDGSAFGVSIEYSISDVVNDTGKRLSIARDKIDPLFLFMYCDNYWPIRLSDMITAFSGKDIDAQITAYSNTDQFTKSNLQVDPQSMVTCYDKKRTMPNLAGVDIGYAIMRKSVLDLIPDGNVSFESTVYPALIAQKKMGAYLTDHRYYSVGSIGRLASTQVFFERRPTILLDRDGVLNQKAPKAEYVKTPNDFKWCPGSLEALVLLKNAGYRVIVVSNQAGVARGVMTEEDVCAVNRYMASQAEKAGGRIEAVYYCPHGWDDGCSCRKPKPGMLFNAQRDFHLDLTRTFFVGDDERDGVAAAAAGTPFLMVTPEQSLLQLIKKNVLIAA